MFSGMSLNASIGLLSSLLEAKNADDFSIGMDKASRQIGFDRFMVGIQWSGTQGAPQFRVISGYPSDWQSRYLQRGYMAVDPTVAYCQTNSDPVIWSDAMFEKTGSMHMLEEARDFGLGFGLSMPVHEIGNVKSMMSLARDRPLNADPREAAELVAAGKVLSSCAHFALRKLLCDDLQARNQHPLTPQEKECLRWLSLGKTSAEIGLIMNISESTAVFHVKNLMGKMDVKNRPQAVAVAFRMGLLN